MPDIPVEPIGGRRYPEDMEARVAVLEQIARATAASLERIERTTAESLERIERTTAASLERIERRLETGFASADNRMDRLDRRMDRLQGDQHSDFRWLLGMMVAATGTTLAAFLGLLGVMAHGFHWL